MTTTVWNGTTTKEGVIVGLQFGGIGTVPSGTTNTQFGGQVAEIKDSDGNFTTGIGIDSGTGTVLKKFSDQTTITASSYAGGGPGTKDAVTVGDILVVTSSATTVYKRGL